MPTRAELLRLKAEECRVIADVFREGNLRAELLTLAEQYERLADSIARLEGTASAAL
jgi:hypothetical protein